MGYQTLNACLHDLEATGRLVRLETPVDAHLEAAEIQRRVFASDGPAVLFTNVKNCRFPMASNLFGSRDRIDYIFRDALPPLRRLFELKVDPGEIVKHPTRYMGVPATLLKALPKRCRRGPVLANNIRISELPQLTSWPDDGGAFITLPQVYTESTRKPGCMHSNLGMYRIQLSGGDYKTDEEIGLHYQLHRGIGVQQAEAMQAGQPFHVNIFVGGAPAMTLAAVMPLPENVAELTFAGMLARKRIRMITGHSPLPIYADADFCICGVVEPGKLLPEGPFGDHLGYYSLTHDFPVLRVTKVLHKPGAIWPFTVVGRPPQEDTFFGQMIHDLTGPIIPSVVHGVRAVHAVDAAGVHPLMLAIGSERYTPYQERSQPAELLTQANAILGQGQMSLAKYLLIVAGEDDPQLDIHNIPAFLKHLLQRIDWRRDLHFQTRTTIDTLDYSSGALNSGSKVVMAAAGPPMRELPTEIPADFNLPEGYKEPRVCLPGVLAVRAPAWKANSAAAFAEAIHEQSPLNQFPLVLLVDDSNFVAESLNNLLWTVFTRSNPAADIQGVGAFIDDKHWGCRGSLILDARTKPHHAPPLLEDPEVCKRIDALAAGGGPLSRFL